MPLTSVAKDAAELTLTVVGDYPVPQQRLWDAFADPRQLERFWGPGRTWSRRYAGSRRRTADEILLIVYPVLLGTGKRLFAEGTPPQTYELADTKAMSSGLIVSSYTVAGPLKAA